MFVFGKEVVPILIDDIITLPLGPVGAINSDTAIIAHLYSVWWFNFLSRQQHPRLLWLSSRSYHLLHICAYYIKLMAVLGERRSG